MRTHWEKENPKYPLLFPLLSTKEKNWATWVFSHMHPGVLYDFWSRLMARAQSVRT
jgi:hypothetical protein